MSPSPLTIEPAPPDCGAHKSLRASPSLDFTVEQARKSSGTDFDRRLLKDVCCRRSRSSSSASLCALGAYVSLGDTDVGHVQQEHHEKHLAQCPAPVRAPTSRAGAIRVVLEQPSRHEVTE
eukprot:scaffold751_cov395-Prasinococcus_capsulatus_cf.AAC.38